MFGRLLRDGAENVRETVERRDGECLETAERRDGECSGDC